MDKKTIFQQAQELMKPEEIETYESDLHLKVTEVSQNLVNEYEFKNSVTRFFSQIDKSYWFDIPFANDGYWNRKKS